MKFTAYFEESLNKSSAAERRIFCPSRAVPKTGNTYSIPSFSELSSESKSPAVGSCRLNQSFLKISDCKHADNFTLFHIHLEFQFPLKIPLGGFQKSLCCPFAFGKHHNVIRIPNDRHAPPCHLLVVLVQVDVGKQGTERASLGRAFFRLHQQPVFHDSGFQVCRRH